MFTKINITSIRHFYITYQWKSHNKPRRSFAVIIPLTSALGQELLILERSDIIYFIYNISFYLTAATYIRYTFIPYIFILLSPVFATTVNIDIKNCNKLMLLQFSFIIRTTYPLTYGNKLFFNNYELY